MNQPSKKPSMINRRNFLGAAAALGGGTALGYHLGRGRRARSDVEARFHGDNMRGDDEPQPVWYRYKFIGQTAMDTQVLWYLGLAAQGMSDIGEVLDTAIRVRAGDDESWFEQWCRIATRLRDLAVEAEDRGHLLSAGSLYMRSATYWRAGLIRYARQADPRLAEATETALDCYDRALFHLGYTSEMVDIPYGETALYGRLYFSPLAEVAPVVMLHQGFHAWPEETMWVIEGALRRGYHVLAFHGPGQGATLRLRGIPFLLEWERVVSAVLDFAEGVERLDTSQAILMGLSFGGFLAARAAAFEHRLRALVLDPGVVNWGGAILRHFEEIPGVLELQGSNPAAFDKTIAGVGSVWADAGWYFEDATWKHGVERPSDLVDELRRYDNTGMIQQIRCQTLVMDGVGEDVTPGQARKLFEELQCSKTWMEFDEDSAAQTHCQTGGSALAQTRLFDWLDEEVRR